MSHPAHVTDSNPYPWPYDGCLVGPHLALLICGAQGVLVDGSCGSEEVAERLRQVGELVRSRGGRVFWIRHGGRDGTARPTGSLPVRSSPGWQLAFEVPDDDEVVDSAGWDGCFGSDLDQALRRGGTTNVILAGYASEITVDSTVRSLNDQGHECLVLTDGCAPLSIELGGRAHHSLTMSGGIFGALGTVANLTQLLERLPLDPTDTETNA
ncbi:MAG: isochorismatase hydrolase [Ilumatobacteraceae bacterium]|nr:isochorismatase hydrolase [Ilumatobacteraceae bacterium]